MSDKTSFDSLFLRHKLSQGIFKESALGRFFHRVAMSVCGRVPFHAIFLARIIVELMAPAIQKTLTINLFHHYLWQNLFPEVRQCNFISAKKTFLPFLDTKPLIVMKILGHYFFYFI